MHKVSPGRVWIQNQMSIQIPRAKLLLNRNKFVFGCAIKSECVTCPKIICSHDVTRPPRPPLSVSQSMGLSIKPYLFMILTALPELKQHSKLGVVSVHVGVSIDLHLNTEREGIWSRVVYGLWPVAEFMATICKQLWFRSKFLADSMALQWD